MATYTGRNTVLQAHTNGHRRMWVGGKGGGGVSHSGKGHFVLRWNHLGSNYTRRVILSSKVTALWKMHYTGSCFLWLTNPTIISAGQW